MGCDGLQFEEAKQKSFSEAHSFAQIFLLFKELSVTSVYERFLLISLKYLPTTSSYFVPEGSFTFRNSSSMDCRED